MQRCANFRVVAGKIVQCDDSAARLNTRDQPFRDFSLIESVGAVGVNLLQTPGNVRQFYRFTGFVGLTVRFAVDTAKFGKLVLVRRRPAPGPLTSLLAVR